jgi:hypothetical protein
LRIISGVPQKTQNNNSPSEVTTMKTQELTPEAKGVLLQQWYQTSLDLKELKEKEDYLRTEVFEQFFTETKEGTNTVNLAKGYKLKAVTGLNRKVDLPAFQAMKEALAEKHIKADKIVEFKPELGLKYYRTLDESELKIVDQFLIISEAKPQISIVIPKGE